MSKDRFKLIPAVFLVLRQDNKVLLLRRANTGYQDGKYSLIAGHLDGDEVATTAIAREATEEAGITIDPKNLKLVHTCHRLTRNTPNQERMDLFFTVESWQGEIKNMEPHKCDDLSWFPINDLPQDIIPIIRNTLTNIANGINFSEYETEPL